MTETNMDHAIQEEEVEVCANCSNVYRLELLKEGEDWNDFGYRHCPFCGMLTDEYVHIGRRVKK